jgi:hypothetical protein
MLDVFGFSTLMAAVAGFFYCLFIWQLNTSTQKLYMTLKDIERKIETKPREEVSNLEHLLDAAYNAGVESAALCVEEAEQKSGYRDRPSVEGLSKNIRGLKKRHYD